MRPTKNGKRISEANIKNISKNNKKMKIKYFFCNNYYLQKLKIIL